MTRPVNGAESAPQPSQAPAADGEPRNRPRRACAGCAERAAANDGQLAQLATVVEAGQLRLVLLAGIALGAAIGAALLGGIALCLVLNQNGD